MRLSNNNIFHHTCLKFSIALLCCITIEIKASNFQLDSEMILPQETGTASSCSDFYCKRKTPCSVRSSSSDSATSLLDSPVLIGGTPKILKEEDDDLVPFSSDGNLASTPPTIHRLSQYRFPLAYEQVVKKIIQHEASNPGMLGAIKVAADAECFESKISNQVDLLRATLKKLLNACYSISFTLNDYRASERSFLKTSSCGEAVQSMFVVDLESLAFEIIKSSQTLRGVFGEFNLRLFTGSYTVYGVLSNEQQFRDWLDNTKAYSLPVIYSKLLELKSQMALSGILPPLDKSAISRSNTDFCY